MATQRKQSKHTELVHIIEYIKHQKYPPGIGEGEKRNIRKRSKSFHLSPKNELIFSSKGFDGTIIERKCLVTLKERTDLIAKMHVTPEGEYITVGSKGWGQKFPAPGVLQN